VAEIHRLQSCRRCRHLFVATPGERLCPDCKQAAKRERARRALFGGAAASTTWSPLLIFAAGTVGLAVAAGLVQPGRMGLAAWIGGIAALVYIGRAR
jgi:hypothetical protein